MKAKTLTYTLCILCLPLFFISITISAQSIDPSQWSSFVKSTVNVQVWDTFHVQTFSGLPHENLNYTVTGSTQIIHSSETDIPDAAGGNLLILRPGSRLVVPVPKPELYTSIKAQAAYAAWDLSPGEILYLTAVRESNPLNKAVYLAPPEIGYRRSFRQKKEHSMGGDVGLAAGNSPSLFQLDVASVDEPSGGYYAIDSLYTFGQIRQYSYFSGDGDWHTTGRWSHQPALRHRHALINGNVNITNPVVCSQIHLGNAHIHIAEGQSLTTQNLLFCTNESTLESAGEVHIKERIKIYRSFPQKGQWYFFSLPFDFYLDEIDPAFEFKDDTPNSGGNYFYLYRYDGEKRAREKTDTDNWEVVKTPTSPDTPLLEKGKGYLIAIDEKANKQTICFSSSEEDIPADFGEKGTLSIVPSIYENGGADQGWYLCGNPLPCPLPLSSFIGVRELDGHVYVYQDNEYKAYPLDENYTLPPFSAFFVKARRSCEITLRLSLDSKSQTLISTTEPLPVVKAEPRVSGSPVSLASSPVIKTSNSYLRMNSLFLEDLLMPGVIYIWDLEGRLYGKREVGIGSSVIDLPSSLPSGNYIIKVKTPDYQSQHLFNWNQSIIK